MQSNIENCEHGRDHLIHVPGLTTRKTQLALIEADNSASPETIYSRNASEEHRRQFAQFFTPPKIAKLMAEWAITPATKSLLEPSVGMGVLVRAALDLKADMEVTAFEKDPLILQEFMKSHPNSDDISVILADFLTYSLDEKFDAVLMNPPYIRHQKIDYEIDLFGYFAKCYGVKLSRLSNLYSLFTLKAAMSLRPGGRASFLIPTEWMNANFGCEMKEFLLHRRLLREIVYFSNCSNIFDGALTTASILLIERPYE